MIKGKNKKKTSINRSEQLHIRLKPEEKKKLKLLAKERGLSLSDYILRSAIQEYQLKSIDPKKYAIMQGITTEMGKIGNNINQATHAIHIMRLDMRLGHEPVKVFNQLLKEYKEIQNNLSYQLEEFIKNQ